MEMRSAGMLTNSAQALPALAQCLAIQQGLDRLVQGLKHAGIQLVAGFAEGGGGDVTGLQGGAGDLLEEAVQFGLQSTLGLIEQKQHQVFEGEWAVTGEILGTLAVLGNKGGVVQ